MIVLMATGNTPIMVAVMIVCSHVPGLRTIAVLLSTHYGIVLVSTYILAASILTIGSNSDGLAFWKVLRKTIEAAILKACSELSTG